MCMRVPPDTNQAFDDTALVLPIVTRVGACIASIARIVYRLPDFPFGAYRKRGTSAFGTI
ncbi:hypothetical protein BN2476_1170002 [Paraburkholderia piptadeniae]|uniref:Uncharacterized protein n=1 Tax=Paraburkholderia piptadeniae TaxID=1701573 RepID=A0A1N7SVI1_9BURK|nr:hypothetical protein BN2476_1170002 [Paraburkholderia piptadeniae]